MIYLMLAYLVTGLATGFLAGLLGVGGGIIVVPALAIIFKYYFPSGYVMHMAIATSLAIMILTVVRAYFAHLKEHVEYWSIAKFLLPGVVVGVIFTSIVAHHLHSNVLHIIFAVFLVIVVFKMLFEREHHAGNRQLPSNCVLSFVGLIIGGASGLLGVGGGTTSIPYLTHYGVSMRRAVMISIVIGFVASVVGTISYMISGMHVSGLPKDCIGYVFWPAWIVVSIGSVLGSPLGAKLSRRLDNHVLKRVFAVFVAIVAIHMFYSIHY